MREHAARLLGVYLPVEEFLPELEVEGFEQVVITFQEDCEIEKVLGEAELEKLLSLLENGVWVRAAAIGVAGAEVHELVSWLDDVSWLVRLAAAVELGKRGECEKLLPLLADRVWQVRYMIVEHFGKDIAVEYLLPLLQEENQRIREATIAALAERVEPELLSPFLADRNRMLQRRVLRAMKERLHEEELLALVRAHQEDWGIVEILSERLSERVLWALFQGEEAGARSAAIGALGERLPMRKLLPLLKDDEPVVRRAVLNAQGRNMPIGFLLPLLNDEDASVRVAAIQALKDRVGVEHLQPLLGDEDWFVRDAVIEAIGEHIETERLLSALYHEGMKSAITALEKRGAIEHLLPLLENEDNRNRGMVLAALERSGVSLSDTVLLQLIGDSTDEVRQLAFRLIQTQAQHLLPEIRAEAKAILAGELPGRVFSSIACVAVARVIGLLEQPAPHHFVRLKACLCHHHWQARYAAVRALGRIRRHIPDPLVQLLASMRLNDPVQILREAADDALASILSLEPMEDEWREELPGRAVSS